jgi:serine protease Do
LVLVVGETPGEPPIAGASSAVAAGDAGLGMALRELTAAERESLGVDFGLVVSRVLAGPAAASELLAGDVILAVGEQPIRSRREFDELVASRAKGEPLALLVRRGEAVLYVALAGPG